MNRRSAIKLVGMSVVIFPQIGRVTVEATTFSVLLDIPVAQEIAQSIATIMATASGDTITFQQIGTFAGDAISCLETIKSILRDYRDDPSKTPPASLSLLDKEIARFAQDLLSIQNSVMLFAANVQKGVGVCVTNLQTVLLGIVAIIPTNQLKLFPQTTLMVQQQGKTLGNIKAVLPTPRHLAQIFNKGITDAGYPQARVHTGFWPPL